MKKTAIFVMILALTLVFTGCGGVEHEPEEKVYDRNAREHWVLGESGEKLKAGAHEPDENNICAVCKSRIEKYADGHSCVYDSDEHENILRVTVYDIDGTVKEETVYEYEYDEYGNIIFENCSVNSVITPSASLSWTKETEYAPDSNGNYYPIRETITYTGGEYAGESIYTEYIEEGPASAVFYYDSDGILRHESHQEYITDENGELYICKSSDYDFINGYKRFYEYRPDGQLLSLEEYNDAGECYRREVYEYDGEDLICYAVFSYGELTHEYYYKTIIDTTGYKYSYIAEEYVFNEDGTGTHYEYGENGEVISEENFG